MNPFSLKQICNKIPFDKSSINKIKDKSATSTQALQYSNYVSNNRRIYKTIMEGQVTILNMISATPNTATITYSAVAKPIYVSMIAVNIQDNTDSHQVNVYSSPYIFQNLRPNSYYTINTYTVYTSGNRFSNVFTNAILTLNEGPPLEPIFITNPEYDSAILNFVSSIGSPSQFDLTVINVDDIYDTNYYPNIKSPFLITGLEPNIKYDISLSSYYSLSNNTYYVYKTGIYGFFRTYNENYPVYINVSNVTNLSATINFSFTGNPSYNLIKLTNQLDHTDVYSVKDIEGNTTIHFNDISINSTYDLTITSYYDVTNHTYTISKKSIFRTLFESEVSDITIVSKSGNQITISFLPSTGFVYSYVIKLRGQTNGQLFELSYNTYPSFVTFSNLSLDTSYNLNVETKYISNIYTSIFPEIIHTLNEGAITNMYYSNVENTSARVSFTPSPGDNPTYYISYAGIRNNTTTYYINGLKDTYFNLTDLIINTPYSFTVNTYYTNPVLYESFHIYSFRYEELFTTLNQGKTTIFNIDVSSTYIDITFINTYGIPSSYLLKAVDIYNNNISSIYTGRSDTTYTIRLSGLSTSTSYTVSINTKYDDIPREYLTTYPTPVITLS